MYTSSAVSICPEHCGKRNPKLWELSPTRVAYHQFIIISRQMSQSRLPANCNRSRLTTATKCIRSNQRWKTGYFRNRTRPKCGINPLFQGFENGSIKNTKEIWTELGRNTLKPTSAFFQRPTAKSGRFYAF